MKYITKPNKSFQQKMCMNKLKVGHTVKLHNKGEKEEKEKLS